MEIKPRFIVVDDDETLLDILKRFLAMQGHDCEVFSSAEAALDHIQEKPCDILITDIVLPGMKGLQLTKEVRQAWPDTLAPHPVTHDRRNGPLLGGQQQQGH